MSGLSAVHGGKGHSLGAVSVPLRVEIGIMYEFLDDPLNWMAMGLGLLTGHGVLYVWDWYWRRRAMIPPDDFDTDDSDRRVLKAFAVMLVCLILALIWLD